MAATWKKIAYEDNVITKALLTTKGDIIGTSAASTPGRLGVGTNGDCLVADNEETLGIKWLAGPTPGAHAASHKNGGSDEILLHELGEPTDTVNFNLQQAQKLVVHTVANEAALPTTGIAVGQLCFATSELTLHICTAT